MYNATELNEFDNNLLHILNQQGIKVMLSVVHDEIERAYAYGHDVGVDEGWCECYETYQDDIEIDWDE